MSASEYVRAMGRPPQRSFARRLIGARLMRWLRIALVLSPTLLAAVYYGLIASDRYVSETRFVIHTASKPASLLGGLSALLQLAGLESSQGESYAVRDYITSRDALKELQKRMDLRGIYGLVAADALSRYPSVVYGSTDEEFYRYFQTMQLAIVNTTSGLTIVRVEAFRAADAQAITQTLLTMSEELVNRLNDRIQQDGLKLALAEVGRAEDRKIATAVAITAFRNREVMLDPNKETTALIGLIGQLSAQLAQSKLLLDETRTNSPNSPQLQSQAQRVTAIERQIDEQRTKFAGDARGLPEKIAAYERLALEDEFALRALVQATISLEAARLEARRQQLFLQRVVEPALPDYALMPQRWRMIGTVFGFNVIGGLVLFLLISGVREHAAGSKRVR